LDETEIAEAAAAEPETEIAEAAASEPV